MASRGLLYSVGFFCFDKSTPGCSISNVFFLFNPGEKPFDGFIFLPIGSEFTMKCQLNVDCRSSKQVYVSEEDRAGNAESL